VQPETRLLAVPDPHGGSSEAMKPPRTPMGTLENPSACRADQQPPLFKKGTCCRFT